MTDRPKVAITVHKDAHPVIEFLHEHAYDVGSITMQHLLGEAAPRGGRWLCVHLTDIDAVQRLSQRMKATFHGREQLIGLTNRVAVQPGPLDTFLLIFLGIPCIEVPQTQ